MNAATHPTREQLSAYLLGDLAESEAVGVVEHLETCGECETTVQELENVADSLVGQLREPAPIDQYADEPEFQEAMAEAIDLGNRVPLVGRVDIDLSGLKSLGQYKLMEKLGEGGMGTVYKARHEALDRIVAVKLLSGGRIVDERVVARFQREMKAVGRVDHPNIVRATDAGEHDGTSFLVMEFIDGLDLNKLVRCCGPLPVADACEMVRQAALGLQCAHEHQLVHRDIKPSNLMITSDGQVKLLDLGLARFQIEEQSVTREVTAPGQTMGTIDYMAPEQIADTHTVDIRADIYALGCTLYKLLAGRPPFSGPEYRTAFDKQMGHVKQQPPSITRMRTDVPDDLVAVIERMLAKDPEQRFATPAEVVAALEPPAAGCDLPGLLSEAAEIIAPESAAVADGSTHDYRPAAMADTQRSHAPARPASRRRRPNRIVAVLAGIAALAGIVALGVLLTLANRCGTLVVETDDPNVEIAVRQNGEEVEVANAESGWKISLKSGEYDVELKGGTDQFQLDRNSVIVKRGGKVAVRVTLKRPEVASPKQQVAAAPHAGGPTGYALLRDISWSKLKADGKLTGGELLAGDSKVPDQLKIENTKDQPTTIELFEIDAPGITGDQYMILGQVRYDDVQGEGHLEMWSCFADGKRFFTKTIAPDGPMKKISGTSPWRPVALPFSLMGQPIRPNKLIVNMVFQGKGTVYLSPLQLRQAPVAPAPPR